MATVLKIVGSFLALVCTAFGWLAREYLSVRKENRQLHQDRVDDWKFFQDQTRGVVTEVHEIAKNYKSSHP